MRPHCAFHAFPERREYDSSSPNNSVSLQQLVNALETETSGLQKLVCYLLEKNERLRMRLRACENAPKPCNSVN